MVKKWAFFDILLYVLYYIASLSVLVWSFVRFAIIMDKAVTLTDVLEKWYIVAIFASTTVLPKLMRKFLRHCIIKEDEISFYSFPLFSSWQKAVNNLDGRLDREVPFSEISSVEVVKLTKEQLESGAFYKHVSNKYLKVNMLNGEAKYVYVGCYSIDQIEDICRVCNERKS